MAESDLEFGVWHLEFAVSVLAVKSQIPDSKFQIPDVGFSISGPVLTSGTLHNEGVINAS